MSGKLNHYKIFIASPGGLAEERKAFRDCLESYNSRDAIDRGYYFQPVGWEETLGRNGRPQAIINEELQKCDFLFLMLHDRWGSPTTTTGAKYSSGTEEEFHVGLECLNSDEFPMLKIALFFKDVPKNQLADPGLQLAKVLQFKKEREENKDFLYETFDDSQNFASQIEHHLSKILRDLELNQRKPEKRKVETKIVTAFEDKSFSWLEDITNHNNWESAYEKVQEYLKVGKVVEAELIFSQITQRSNNPFLMAKYGKYLRNQGRIHSAMIVLNKAKELAQTFDDFNSVAYCYRQIGRVEEYKGKMNKALEFFEKAYEIYKKHDNKFSIARTLRDIAFVENKLGNSENAIAYISDSIDIYDKLEKPMAKAASLGYLGVIYKDIGEFDKATNAHERALEIQKLLGNKEALARIYSNIGVIERLKRNYNKALDLHKQSLKIFDKLNDKRGIARENTNIAVILRRQEKFEKAIEKHYIALEIEEKVSNERGMQISFSNIGMNYLELSDFDKAEYYFDKSLQISKNLDDIKGQSHQYKNFASLNLKRDKIDKALKFADKALDLDKMTDNIFGVAGCKRLYASIYIQGEFFIQAENVLIEAKKIYIDMNLIKYVEEIEKDLKIIRDKITK